MSLYNRVSRPIRANLDDINQASDPLAGIEKLLLEMQEALVQTRQAVINEIADQKPAQQQFEQAIAEATKWQRRERLASEKAASTLAQHAALQKKRHTDAAKQLKEQLKSQELTIEIYKRHQTALESKMSEVKRRRDQ
ncbi:MAG: PspA/IM30 family protein [Myxacorys chilensis ATA2-1-KO14]|nr:PspA/IM30 family protein [Myxacorys chilensis ATA2-1-KO14]